MRKFNEFKLLVYLFIFFLFFQSEVKSATVSITTPSLSVTTVTVNNINFSGTASGTNISVRYSTDRDIVGNCTGTTSWSANIPLKPGYNRVLIQVHESNSSIATAERVVYYDVPGALGISNITENRTIVPRWEMLEIIFNVDNSAATNVQFPYDPSPAPSLGWVDGISVDGLFTNDNWVTVYRRPGFYYQRYTRAKKNNWEWLYPEGNPVWCIRFSPPELGTWKYKIEVKERKGTVVSQERTFTVVPSTIPWNHGPVRVSKTDKRYFEFYDGTPFLGIGFNDHNIDDEAYSYSAEDLFNKMGNGNAQLLRWWQAGRIWASAWQPWTSATLGNATNSPRTGLVVTEKYGNGFVSLRLNSNNPLMFQGFRSGRAGVISGRTYRFRVRWRTQDATGNGASVRITNNFPEVSGITSYTLIIPHIKGTTPWHVSTGTWVANGDFVPYVCLCFEGSGTAYIDECAMHEVLGDGTLGPQLLRTPKFNSHYTMDPRRSAGMDWVFKSAEEHDVYIRMIIAERNEEILNRMKPDGTPDPNWDEFDMYCPNLFAGPETPGRRLHEYYWRYLFARYNAYRSVHSWELVNEAATGYQPHYSLAAHLALKASEDGNPHLTGSSTWASLDEAGWKMSISSPISHTDFHCYLCETDWLPNCNDLKNDTARAFIEYDNAVKNANFGKPTLWGETGIQQTYSGDTTGIWLHKFVWARCNAGAGTYTLFWWTDDIFNRNLFNLFGNWRKFMDGIPVSNGRYVDAQATPSNIGARVLGQKDIQDGRAYLWIDNKDNTWSSPSSTPLTFTVTINMGTPNSDFTATWYDTRTGNITSSQQVTSNSSGVITLNVNNLSTDTAVRLSRATPDAPSNLTVTLYSTNQAKLSWKDNSSTEQGFKIEKKTGSGGTYLQISTAGANVTTYIDSNILPNTTYYYRVRCYNANGDSAYSNEASFTLPVPKKISLTANPQTLQKGGTDTSTLTATIQDEYGNTVAYATNTVRFTVQSGGGTLEGTNPVSAEGGIATITYRSGNSTGTVTVTATSQGLTQGSVNITVIETVQNRPPNKPTTLLCNNLTNPKDLTDTNPVLSWTFSDPDTGDMQSAYKVLVADSISLLNSHTGNIWNTGKVQSLQNYAQYNGMALLKGVTYYWKVMVWDGHDVESEYSSIANFCMAAEVQYENPAISVSSTSLNFGDVDIGKTKTLKFQIINIGKGTLTGTISTSQPWITVQPHEFSGDTDVSVTVDNEVLNMKKGIHTGFVNIRSNGGDVDIEITLNATCVLTAPNPYNPYKGKLKFFGDGIIPQETVIKICTLSGEVITEILADENEVFWDGKDKEGRFIGEGVYIYTYQSPKEKGTGKFTVIK